MTDRPPPNIRRLELLVYVALVLATAALVLHIWALFGGP